MHIFLSRLDKINKCEIQLLSGKALNEEQKQLLPTKPSVEKALIELESIKSQLEDVAKLVCIISFFIYNQNMILTGILVFNTLAYNCLDFRLWYRTYFNCK